MNGFLSGRQGYSPAVDSTWSWNLSWFDLHIPNVCQQLSAGADIRSRLRPSDVLKMPDTGSASYVRKVRLFSVWYTFSVGIQPTLTLPVFLDGSPAQLGQLLPGPRGPRVAPAFREPRALRCRILRTAPRIEAGKLMKIDDIIRRYGRFHGEEQG